MKPILYVLIVSLWLAVASYAETIELPSTLIVRPDSPELATMAGNTYKPSKDWADPNTPLIKFTSVGYRPPRHFGLLPNFTVRDVTLDCDHRCAGVWFDRVVSSRFDGLTVTGAFGNAMRFSRTKESSFRVVVTNCMRVGSESLIDFEYLPPNIKTKIDGNNNLWFGHSRFVFNNHDSVMRLSAPKQVSTLRMITFRDCQFHDPPKRGFVGIADPDFPTLNPVPMIQADKRFGYILFDGCNFRCRGKARRPVTVPNVTYQHCRFHLKD